MCVISNVPGKNIHTSDYLSCAPVNANLRSVLHDQASQFADTCTIVGNLPCINQGLEKIKQLRQDDEVCIKIMQYSKDEWPK